MIAFLHSAENLRLIILVSSVGRIEVAVGASFKGIVKSFSAGLPSTRMGRAIEVLAVKSHLNGTPKALSVALEVSAHGDDPLRTWHFEYHIWIVRYGHEFCQSRPPNNSFVSAVETCHLESHELSLLVL
jgi:hypothetical protein